MHNILSLTTCTDFSPLRRKALETLQVQPGYRCNQTWDHAHVNAGLNRTEIMDWKTVRLVLDVQDHRHIRTLDLTGGAPELN